MNKLIVGDWIKADVIGLGFYEVVSIDDYHISIKCLRLFDGKNPEWKGHITNCHHGIIKDTRDRIKIDHAKWYSRKVKRLSK